MSKTNLSQLKVGQKLSETQFYNVDKIVGDQIQLTPEGATEPIIVSKGYLESNIDNPYQFSKVEKKSRTELIQIFESLTNVVVSANFNKKVDEKDVVAELLATHTNTAPKDVEKEFKKAVKRALEGEERTMVGRHYGHKNEFGRINFVDMEEAIEARRNKQVDPRTLNYVIARGVKYEVK